ncbi:vacuolar protein sorting-associated protein 11, putative [Plasmodium vinckei]|uniref:Vacuolar protein sorting-associated protein 11, putative n=1 Tax=Plasmodium vinckei TaxID=5860 RepID=A0A6V7T4B3_PLAVN|nr:vacuolar protein sorting-associated protein 11, putative [Plasmodium vinckei]
MFNFRNILLFNRDQTKDTRGIKHFLNSYEGIYFSLSKKFINVFVDKIHYIDPVNLSSITINTDFIVIDYCFNETHKNLLVLGKAKNVLLCSIYNIRDERYILVKKVQISKNIQNSTKTLISKCLSYIITLEKKKVSFYLFNNDYYIVGTEFIEVEEDLFENMYLCKDNILVIIKKNAIDIYKLIINSSSISYTHIQEINLSITINDNDQNNQDEVPNDTKNFEEPLISAYNEQLNVLYICDNSVSTLYIIDLTNRSLEFVLLENKVVNLFTVKFYLIILNEINKKLCLNIYIIYEDIKLLAYNTTINYLITNVAFFNNLIFLIIDQQVNNPDVKVDKLYFYEQLVMKWNGKDSVENIQNIKRGSKDHIINNSYEETGENILHDDIDILQIYNDNVNNNNNEHTSIDRNSLKGIGNNNNNTIKYENDKNYDIFLEKKTDKIKHENNNNNIESKQLSIVDPFKLNKFSTTYRNKIKLILKEKNVNEIVNIFKKKKLFLWLIKYSNLNKNYHHSINFPHIHKIYADFLFEKEQYERAMDHYINTIEFLETATVIQKYLNLDLYEYLSIYLEKLHDLNIFNDEHTMILLSCYKRQYKKKKIISFIKNNKNKINLNKAYKFLLNIGYYNVVLNFSKKNKDHLTYTSILIDKYENYQKCLKYIFKLDIQNICILLFKYGYKFIKYFPDLTISLLKKIIKKYDLNLTIFIPLFLDNNNFLFNFILKFLDKNEKNNLLMQKSETHNSKTNTNKESKQHHEGYTKDNLESDERNKMNNADRMHNKKIEFDIFNDEYDYVLFITVMQILLQKFKQKENNSILTYNIDKLIKNNDKNITYLSVILLSIYNYNKGLLYISNKMNKYDISFLFYTNKIINKFKSEYNQQLKLLKQNELDQNLNVFQELESKFNKNVFNSCLHLLKLNDCAYYNYIFYYLSILNDDQLLIKFIKIMQKKYSLSILNFISILQKYNKNYNCIKKILLTYINEMDQDINDKCMQILTDKKELYKLNKKKYSYKYNFRIIDNTYCYICKDVLSLPVVHFMCNHSYHYYCLNETETCILCRNKDNEKKLLKDKAKNAVTNFDEFFKFLQGSNDKFAFISNYLSYDSISTK